jgi:hypothetical protein
MCIYFHTYGLSVVYQGICVIFKSFATPVIKIASIINIDKVLLSCLIYTSV